MKRKILAFALALCMILAVMPVGVFAEDDEVRVNYSYPNGGSVFTDGTIDITVSLENAPKTKALGVGISVDDDYFEILSGEWLINGVITNFDIERKKAAYTATSEIDPNRDIFVFTLKAKKDCPQYRLPHPSEKSPPTRW